MDSGSLMGCTRCGHTILRTNDTPFLQIGWPVPDWRRRICIMPGANLSSPENCLYFKERENQRKGRQGEKKTG